MLWDFFYSRLVIVIRLSHCHSPFCANGRSVRFAPCHCAILMSRCFLLCDPSTCYALLRSPCEPLCRLRGLHNPFFTARYSLSAMLYCAVLATRSVRRRGSFDGLFSSARSLRPALHGCVVISTTFFHCAVLTTRSVWLRGHFDPLVVLRGPATRSVRLRGQLDPLFSTARSL